jgi:hypothetical protein
MGSYSHTYSTPQYTNAETAYLIDDGLRKPYKTQDKRFVPAFEQYQYPHRPKGFLNSGSVLVLARFSPFHFLEGTFQAFPAVACPGSPRDHTTRKETTLRAGKRIHSWLTVSGALCPVGLCPRGLRFGTPGRSVRGGRRERASRAKAPGYTAPNSTSRSPYGRTDASRSSWPMRSWPRARRPPS